MIQVQRAYRFDKPDWLHTRLPTWERLLLPLRGQPLQILEIGSYEGRSAVWFAENLLGHPGSSLTCIDPCPAADVAANLEHNICVASAHGNAERALILHRLPSVKVLPMLLCHGRRYDLVYIDGSHEAPDVLLDLVLSFELTRAGGQIIADDYLWSQELDGTTRAPRLAINAFAAVYAERVELVHRDAQAWFRKR